MPNMDGTGPRFQEGATGRGLRRRRRGWRFGPQSDGCGPRRCRRGGFRDTPTTTGNERTTETEIDGEAGAS